MRPAIVTLLSELRPLRRHLLPTLLLGCLALFPGRASAQPIASIVAFDSLAIEPTAAAGNVNVPQAGALASGSLRISLSRDAATAVTVRYTVSGTATGGSDYTALSGSATIAAGARTTTITVVPIDDAQPERDETVIVTLTPGTGYELEPTKSPVSARVVLIDNDQTVQITSSDNQAAEPGVNVAQLRFERMGTLRGRLSVPLSLTGSASNGSDIVALPDSIVFAEGQAAVSLTVTPRPDSDTEGTETLTVRVGSVLTLPANGVPISIIDAVVRVTSNVTSVNETAGASATFVLTRTGDLSAAQTISLTAGGSATRGTDYTGIPNTTTFAAGVATVNVPVSILADATAEGAETIVLSTTGNAQLALGSPGSATLVIDEVGLVLISAFTLTPTTVAGGTPVIGSLTLNSPAPVGGQAVSLTLTGGAAQGAATLPGATVVIPAGQQSTTFTIQTVAVAASVQGTVGAVIGQTAPVTRNFSVTAPQVSTFVLSQASVTPQAARDSTSVTSTLTLTAPAPAGGLSFPITSSNSALITSATLEVPAGQTSVIKPVTVFPVASATSASLSVAPGKSATLQINPPAPIAIAFNRPSVTGTTDGAALATATISLNAPAPASGLAVVVTGTTPLSTVTPSVPVPANTTVGTIGVRAVPVAVATNGSITATVGAQSVSGTLSVLPPRLLGLTVSPDSLIGGSADANAVVRLSDPAAAGFSVPVTSSNPSAFPCINKDTPRTALTAIAGQITIPFTVCTRSVAARSVVAIGAGVTGATFSDELRLLPRPPAVRVVLADVDIAGDSALRRTGTILLDQPAPSLQTYQMITSDPAVQIVAGSSATIAAGQNSTGFEYRTFAVAVDRQVSITATPAGAAPAPLGASAQVRVRAPTVSSLNAQGLPETPMVIAPGTSANAGVVLNVRAPDGGFPVSLVSSNAAISVPSIITVPRDTRTAVFEITAPATGGVDATITATTGTTSRTLQVRVSGGSNLASFTMQPGSLFAGDSAIGTVTLGAPAAAGGAVVNLSVSNTAVALVPPTITIPAGQLSGTFAVRTVEFANSTLTNVAVSAAVNGPASVRSFAVNPFRFALSGMGAVIGGDSLVGTITLPRPAHAGGYTVSVAAPSPPFLSDSTAFTIPAGQSSAQLRLATSAVSSTQSRTLAFSRLGFTVNQNVSIVAPQITGLSATPSTVNGGSTIVVQVTISATAGPSGVIVGLSVPPGAPITLPPNITIQPGQATASITVPTTSVTAAGAFTITATLGASVRTTTLTVTP